MIKAYGTLHYIKQGWQCYQFLFGYLISCKSCVETLGLWKHFLRIPLSWFFPVSLFASVSWESHWFVSAFSNIKHQYVCRFCAGVDWQDSVFQLPTRSGGSRGKAVDVCWFMANKAQLATNFKIWEEHL